jgi:hypothetical protein
MKAGRLLEGHLEVDEGMGVRVVPNWELLGWGFDGRGMRVKERTIHKPF